MTMHSVLIKRRCPNFWDVHIHVEELDSSPSFMRMRSNPSLFRQLKLALPVILCECIMAWCELLTMVAYILRGGGRAFLPAPLN